MEKILIITYYWPTAGGPGVQRWLKFVKYLRDFDYEPVVYTPENPHYPILDPSLETEIPKNVQVVKNKIFEPYAAVGLVSKKEIQKISSGIISEKENQGFLQKLLLYIRGNFFIPDARKFWIKPSVSFLSEFLEEEGIKTVITTGPPHSMHLIGLGLKKDLDIKWIADFRDPWTSIGYHKKLKLTANSLQQHKDLENKVLQEADRIITTSFTLKKEFQEKTTTPVSVITNGFDTEKEIALPLDEEFSISHIGSLLSDRNPLYLWEALKELKSENESFSKDFRLKLTGTIGEPVLNAIKGAGLEENLEVEGYVPHKKAVEQQRKSQILLLIEVDNPDNNAIIPGKLFEYMAAKRPVLAVGPENSDIKRIISETNTGKFFIYREKEEMKNYILESYRSFKINKLEVNPVGLEKYSRKKLTGELAKLL